MAISFSRRKGGADESTGFLTRPVDDPMLERTEAALRRVQAAASPQQAAILAAEALPELTGVDWAAFSPAETAANRAHAFLACAALADGCVYSQGEPATVAAVPVMAAKTPVGVILMGRKAGLCTPQLRTAALFAEHAGGVAASMPLAQTA
ncbi:MAG TPA: hypothetical protein VGL44_03765 [Gaiellales bacterium]